MSKVKIAIIGGGLIGRGWIPAFARAGMEVVLWSRSEATSNRVVCFLESVLPLLHSDGLLNGLDPREVLNNVKFESSLERAVEGAAYIQENLPEDLDAKRAIFSALDAVADPRAIIASSTSALLPSAFTDHLPGRRRCLVAHPLNPPYLMPAVEVVPAAWTGSDAVARTCEILRRAGQRPVLLTKEIDGFVVNRLQGVLLNEAFRLVSEGYASIEDVDTAIKDGLALRWSFMGPFETIDLNAPNGVRDYVERNEGMFGHLLGQMQTSVQWSGDVLDVIERDRRNALPAEKLNERQIWRDRRLMALANHKREADAAIGA
jgi:L-gulonate 3-dehydrogenase